MSDTVHFACETLKLRYPFLDFRVTSEEYGFNSSAMILASLKEELHRARFGGGFPNYYLMDRFSTVEHDHIVKVLSDEIDETFGFYQKKLKLEQVEAILDSLHKSLLRVYSLQEKQDLYEFMVKVLRPLGHSFPSWDEYLDTLPDYYKK